MRANGSWAILVVEAGTLRSLPDAGSTVAKVHRQVHPVQVAMALSAKERDGLQ